MFSRKNVNWGRFLNFHTVYISLENVKLFNVFSFFKKVQKYSIFQILLFEIFHYVMRVLERKWRTTQLLDYWFSLQLLNKSFNNCICNDANRFFLFCKCQSTVSTFHKQWKIYARIHLPSQIIKHVLIITVLHIPHNSEHNLQNAFSVQTASTTLWWNNSLNDPFNLSLMAS